MGGWGGLWGGKGPWVSEGSVIFVMMIVWFVLFEVRERFQIGDFLVIFCLFCSLVRVVVLVCVGVLVVVYDAVFFVFGVLVV